MLVSKLVYYWRYAEIIGIKKVTPALRRRISKMYYYDNNNDIAEVQMDKNKPNDGGPAED